MVDIICDFDKGPEKIRLYNVLKGLKGKNVIQIKKWRKKRSVSQNDYYFGCIVKPLADEFGYDLLEMHSELKRMFNPVQKVNKLTGEQIIFGGSTTEFDTLQAEAYYESIRIWALAEYSILLMLPNEPINND
jgi:hypothetical protein